MNELISRRNQYYLRIFGIYQIIGATIYLAYFFLNFHFAIFLNVRLFVFFFSIIGLFCYSIYCGNLCLKPSLDALKYSLINQLLQVFGFAVFGFVFIYDNGVRTSLILDLSDSVAITEKISILGTDISINAEPEKLEISFNILAIVFVYWLDVLIREYKKSLRNKNQ